jgi:aspartyl protease family protein
MLKPKRINSKTHILLFTSLFFLSSTSVCFAIDKIVINGLFKDKAIVTIDGKQRVLRKGKASPEGALLIESNSKEAIIEINGEQETYSLGSHIGGNFSAPTEGKKLILTPDSGGMYNINGTINGSNVSFVVDTGATLVSMNSNVAKKIGIDYKLNGRQGSSYTASGKEKIYIVNLKKVKVGDIELHNVQGAVHEGNFPIITLLGMSFLGKLDMKREGRILELQKKY